ncbi:MAG: AraC family transcriptional regulator [Epulopiscium sp.]|nr:AraC family transcriptional regulator [Candidatus Epulonipiscium sp.]
MGKAYYKLIFSFLMVIIVCVSAFGVYSYNSVTKDNKERGIINNEILLNIYADKIDGSLLEMENNLIQNGLVIETFDGLTLPSPQSVDYLSQKKNMNLNDFVVHLDAGSKILDNVMIYYRNEGVFLTSNGRFWEDEFWGQKIVENFKNDNSNKVWVGPLKIYSPSYGRDIWGISYIRQLPLITSYKKAAFIATVDLMKLSNLVGSEYEGQRFFIVNDEGTVLVDKEKDLIGKDISIFPFIQHALAEKKGYSFCKDENNNTVLMSYTDSDISSWKYIIVTPVDSLFESSKTILRTTVYICVTIIIIGMLLSILLSKLLYTPIRTLLSLADENILDVEKKHRLYDEYGFINNLFNKLRTDNKDLMKQIRSNLETVKEKLLLDILKGHIEEEVESTAILKSYGFDITGQNYIVIAVEISDEKQVEFFGRKLCLFSMKNIMSEVIHVEYKGLITSEDNTIFAIIYFPHTNYNFDYKHTGEYLCSRIQENIEKFISLKVSIGISRCYNDITRLSTAYMEAKEAIKYMLTWEDQALIFIEDVEPKGHGLRNYPYQLGQDLIKHIKTGDIQSTENILHKIIKFFRDNKFNYASIQQFFIQMLGLLIISLQDMGYEINEIFEERHIYRELEQQRGLEATHIWLRGICNHIVNYITEERKKRSRDIVLSAKEHIDKYYTNADLTLTSVAESLYISDSYLSRIFKEEAGENFWNYITDKRMEKGKELLLSTDMSIKEISNEIGLSIQSFMRNFKKQENITPGQYRTKFKN